MIKNQTVVVVGAGASKDVGMPLGDELKSKVANAIRNTSHKPNNYIKEALNRYYNGGRSRLETAWNRVTQLHKQLESAASIDNFLDQHRDEPDLVSAAKAFLVYELADAERSSTISGPYEPERIIEGAQDHFIPSLMNILVRGHTAKDMKESFRNLTFVIFNYDRCIERLIHAWLNFRFGSDALHCMKEIRFIHVYGSLGDYPPGGGDKIFGRTDGMAFLNPHFEIPEYIDKLKVFTEQEDSEINRSITRSLGNAATVLFLGVGFEEQNMRFFPKLHGPRRVFATLFGQSDENSTFLKGELGERFSIEPDAVFGVRGKCKQVFEDCYHPLTRAVGSL